MCAGPVSLCVDFPPFAVNTEDRVPVPELLEPTTGLKLNVCDCEWLAVCDFQHRYRFKNTPGEPGQINGTLTVH